MTPTESVRVVIDTNVMLDWLVFGDANALELAAAVLSRRLAWHASTRMLDELSAVLSRAWPERWEVARKHALTIDAAAWATMHPEPLSPSPAGLICRDPDDQMFIDLALQCSPSWLLTRDRALLALRRRAAALGVVIVTPAQWRRADPDQPAVAPST